MPAAPAPAPAVAAGGPAGRSRGGRLGGVLQAVLLVVGLGLLVGGFGLAAVDYRPYSVPTGSMAPTIAAGDTVLARKVDGGAVGRGDIVVFRDQAWGGETLVKRVVGVGGDTVVCCDAQHRLTVNGTSIDEPYLAPSTVPVSPFSAVVPAGRLFLLGDNRIGSQDSRVHLDQVAGTVPATDVIARVEAVALPSDHTRLVGRTVAFDGLGGPAASRPGPLEPAVWASVGGAVLIVLTASVASLASLVRRRRVRMRPTG
ncbi:signal peptidase I [Kitasatospora nipponensis]|uniref:signal peptidase I n=1 Tax=Kitasatospora nipponensis TaxID=258049 RepID=UPI0031D0AE5C